MYFVCLAVSSVGVWASLHLPMNGLPTMVPHQEAGIGHGWVTIGFPSPPPVTPTLWAAWWARADCPRHTPSMPSLPSFCVCLVAIFAGTPEQMGAYPDNNPQV